MQHRYFGDVGDYGKYGLLRVLCGNENTRLRLGVIWYLYPDESHNQDGKHLGYLKTENYRACDEFLYDGLRAKLLDDAGEILVHRRNLGTLTGSHILPDDSAFFSEPLSFPAKSSAADRRCMREAWFADALRQTVPAELVFLDPDNGIECASVSRFSRKGPKYTYWDDIAAIVARNQSVVVYHHLNRSAVHSQQVKVLLNEIRLRFPGCDPLATIFRRGSGRAYFIIPSTEHHLLLHERLDQFALSQWNSHFLTAHSSAVGG
jgi:hypothetical protein